MEELIGPRRTEKKIELRKRMVEWKQKETKSNRKLDG